MRIKTGASWDGIQAEVARRLAATDRYTLPDYPLDPACREPLLAYRQALRDLNRTYAEPAEVVFPPQPTILKVTYANA